MKEKKKKKSTSMSAIEPENEGGVVTDPLDSSTSATSSEPSLDKVGNDPATVDISLEQKTEAPEPNELDILRCQLAEMTENWQRERASFQNYRKRVEEEKREARKYASFELARDLIRLMDYFETSLTFSKNLPDESQCIADGVKYIIEEFSRVLAVHGINPIEVNPGEIYNSNVMEAVERQINEDVASGTILEVRRRGWMYCDRVLRPVQVVVAVTSENAEGNSSGEKEVTDI